MDWELYERYRATLLLMGVVFISILLLLFQRTAVVRHLRAFLVVATVPTERLLAGLKSSSEAAPVATSTPPLEGESPEIVTGPSWGLQPEARRTTQILKQENKRLRDLLELREQRWPKTVAAHVVGRDPQRWFQELVLDKGRVDGLDVGNPVLAVVEGREGLVGRVSEVAERVAKVMLIQDSLSAVAATVLGSGADDGVVEGSNSHDLYLRYIDRNSRVKIGDPVLTSGLGKNFPEGIPIGWVDDMGLDPRQLFLQARLRPAVQTGRLRVVLVFVHGPERIHE